MAIGRDSFELLDKLGYNFADVSYLDAALTHSSYTNELRSRGMRAESNERLEFLGDAVLQLVISEQIYSSYSKHREGALTKMRQQLVCEKTLAKIASKFDLGEYIHLGRGEEVECRTRPKVLADTFEAVLGAMFLDCRDNSSELYKDVIIKLFESEFINSTQKVSPDYKTMLQQFIEKDGSSILEYEVIDQKGPEHKKEFTVIAKVNNNVVGKGIANSKKNSEMQAAKHALRLFGFKI